MKRGVGFSGFQSGIEMEKFGFPLKRAYFSFKAPPFLIIPATGVRDGMRPVFIPAQKFCRHLFGWRGVRVKLRDTFIEVRHETSKSQVAYDK